MFSLFAFIGTLTRSVSCNIEKKKAHSRIVILNLRLIQGIIHYLSLLAVDIGHVSSRLVLLTACQCFVVLRRNEEEGRRKKRKKESDTDETERESILEIRKVESLREQVVLWHIAEQFRLCIVEYCALQPVYKLQAQVFAISIPFMLAWMHFSLRSWGDPTGRVTARHIQKTTLGETTNF